MTKKELIDEIYEASAVGISRADVRAVLDVLAKTAAQAVARGETFEVPGIVRLGIVERRPRIARNPATGAPVEVPAKKAVKAKVAKAFADSVGYYEAGGK